MSTSDNVELYQVVLILVGFVAVFMAGFAIAMSFDLHWFPSLLIGCLTLLGFSTWFFRRLEKSSPESS